MKKVLFLLQSGINFPFALGTFPKPYRISRPTYSVTIRPRVALAITPTLWIQGLQIQPYSLSLCPSPNFSLTHSLHMPSFIYHFTLLCYRFYSYCYCYCQRHYRRNDVALELALVRNSLSLFLCTIHCSGASSEALSTTVQERA